MVYDFPKKKKKLIYEYLKNESYVLIYDGKKIEKIEIEKFKNIFFNDVIKSPNNSVYTYIQKNNDNKKIEDYYNYIINEANILKEKTNGKINLYISGSYKKSALKLFYELNHIKPKIIKDDESLWINASTQSALFHCIPDYKGPGYKYDINSQYPYIMAYGSYKFPIKKGKFMKIDNIDHNNILYGIYRANIYIDDNINSILFKFNNMNDYTHIDKKYAYVP